MLLSAATRSGKFLQRTSAPQFLGVVDHGLDAKYALAFGIDLQSQLAAVQLEDRQIIRRSLDRYFPFGATCFSACDILGGACSPGWS